jgi:hypothetical protein
LHGASAKQEVQVAWLLQQQLLLLLLHWDHQVLQRQALHGPLCVGHTCHPRLLQQAMLWQLLVWREDCHELRQLALWWQLRLQLLLRWGHCHQVVLWQLRLQLSVRHHWMQGLPQYSVHLVLLLLQL